MLAEGAVVVGGGGAVVVVVDGGAVVDDWATGDVDDVAVPPERGRVVLELDCPAAGSVPELGAVERSVTG